MGEKETRKIFEALKKFKKHYEKKFGIDEIIIFGSFVKGSIKKDSDIDIIVVSKKYSLKDFFSITPKFYVILHKDFKIERPIDILLYNKEEFEKEKKKISIVSEALKYGVVIK